MTTRVDKDKDLVLSLFPLRYHIRLALDIWRFLRQLAYLDWCSNFSVMSYILLCLGWLDEGKACNSVSGLCLCPAACLIARYWWLDQHCSWCHPSWSCLSLYFPWQCRLSTGPRWSQKLLWISKYSYLYHVPCESRSVRKSCHLRLQFFDIVHSQKKPLHFQQGMRLDHCWSQKWPPDFRPAVKV